MLYNVGIMRYTLQLTIRGLDSETKTALVRKANQQGISLNRYALKALKQSIGMEDSEKRYKELKQFLSDYKIEKREKEAIDGALSWSDKTSLLKQSKDNDSNV